MVKIGNLTVNSGGGAVAIGDNATAFGRSATDKVTFSYAPEQRQPDDSDLSQLKLALAEVIFELSKVRSVAAESALAELKALDARLDLSDIREVKDDVAASLGTVCNISGIAANIVTSVVQIATAFGLAASRAI